MGSAPGKHCQLIQWGVFAGASREREAFGDGRGRCWRKQTGTTREFGAELKGFWCETEGA